MPRATLLAPLCGVLLTATTSTALARDFLVMRDDGGSVADADGPNLFAMRNALLDAYEAAALPLPEVLSVWTTFPMNGNNFATYIDPRANDVTGIGLEETFPPDGIKEATTPPLRAILWHNNVDALPQRASLHEASEEGYGRYLFLLELSHLWGPDIAVPVPDPGALIGFSYHWSFFNDQPSPAGGNAWVDNGDGTFTVVPGSPSGVAFSPLDLYLMGLVPESEVPAFGVLEPTDVPASPTDPFWGGSYAARSFPWFDDSSTFTVTATRRELTIDDVIAANGPRVPAAGEKSSWTLGLVLVVPEQATDEELEAAAEAFEPFAATLAPAFSEATGELGSLEVVSVIDEPGEGGAGGAGGAGAGGESAAGGAGEGGSGGSPPPADEGCSCTSAGATDEGSSGWGLAAALAAFGLGRASASVARRRSREGEDSCAGRKMGRT